MIVVSKSIHINLNVEEAWEKIDNSTEFFKSLNPLILDTKGEVVSSDSVLGNRYLWLCEGKKSIDEIKVMVTKYFDLQYEKAMEYSYVSTEGNYITIYIKLEALGLAETRLKVDYSLDGVNVLSRFKNLFGVLKRETLVLEIMERLRCVIEGSGQE